MPPTTPDPASSDKYGSFAQRMMAKQGWKEGEGLGKSGQGLKTPLKPRLKFDQKGVGHDYGKEFTDHWWAQAFNRAAGKINIVGGSGGDGDDEDEGQEAGGTKSHVRVEMKKTFSKKEKREQKQQQKNKLYAKFVKSAVLDSGKMVNHTSDADDTSDDDDSGDVKKSFGRLTDDQLFEACGGMTAHKGARHGHKMDDKKRRVEEMEKRWLEELEERNREEGRGKRQRKKEKDANDLERRQETKSLSLPLQSRVIKKKKKRKAVLKKDKC